MRWAYRLAKRDWRQYTVIVVLLTIAVAASAFVTAAAYNLAPAGADAEFGSAGKALYLDGDNVTPDRHPRLGRGRCRFVRRGGSDRPPHDPGPRDDGLDRLSRPGDRRPVRRTDADAREGRAPSSDAEAAITVGVASMLDVGIGDTIDADGTSRQVVGIVEDPSNLNDEFVLVPPSDLEQSQSVTMLFDSSETQLRIFGDKTGGIRARPSAPTSRRMCWPAC